MPNPIINTGKRWDHHQHANLGHIRYMEYKSGFGAKEVPRAEFIALFREARDAADPGLGLEAGPGWTIEELIKG
jgi:hypothetical protein